MNTTRREFLKCSIKCAAMATPIVCGRSVAGTTTDFGGTELTVLTDGSLSIPSRLILPTSVDEAEKATYLKNNELDKEFFQPDCNITLWRNEDRLMLFDVGAGTNFMPSAGKLLEDLESLNIDPSDITDVVFTHAHPDHLWGLVDDFDELAFPQAAFFMHEQEWDYWRADSTFDALSDERKSFAVGAKNRFAYIEDQINLFRYGDEVLPGVEAVDTHGHTPGHTSFALHAGSTSTLVLGDALTHPVLSFQMAHWPSGLDQDPDAGRATRLALLDRLAGDKMQIVGYHLPHPGTGRVERTGSAYRFAAT